MTFEEVIDFGQRVGVVDVKRPIYVLKCFSWRINLFTFLLVCLAKKSPNDHALPFQF